MEYKYDFKRLVRDICLSQTYQRATQTNASNEGDQRNFAHARVRRIQAEMLRDCITQVTETKDKFRGLPLGARAVQIADGATVGLLPHDFWPFASRDGLRLRRPQPSRRCRRPCTCSTATPCRTRSASGQVIQHLLAAKKSPEEIIRTLFVRCLSREPAADELDKLKKLVEGQPKPAEVLEDIFWSLLNSREFCFNH